MGCAKHSHITNVAKLARAPQAATQPVKTLPTTRAVACFPRVG